MSCFFFFQYQNIPHGNFSLLKCKQLSGWAGKDKTCHLHDNIALVIAYFLMNKRKIKEKKERRVGTSRDIDYTELLRPLFFD